MVKKEDSVISSAEPSVTRGMEDLPLLNLWRVFEGEDEEDRQISRMWRLGQLRLELEDYSCLGLSKYLWMQGNVGIGVSMGYEPRRQDLWDSQMADPVCREVRFAFRRLFRKCGRLPGGFSARADLFHWGIQLLRGHVEALESAIVHDLPDTVSEEIIKVLRGPFWKPQFLQNGVQSPEGDAEEIQEEEARSRFYPPS